MRTAVFAHLVLLLWVPVSLLAFLFFRPQVAVVAVLLGGTMFLPERIAWDFSGIPALDKNLLPSLCAFVLCLIIAPKQLAGARPGRGIESLVVVLMAGAILTALSNTDEITDGLVALSGLRLYDGISYAVADLLTFGLPFFLGRALFRRSKDLSLLLGLIAGAGLIYSVFILYEVRMSPSLHSDIYGYVPLGGTRLTRRLGGYRPLVFMSWGGALALFALVAAMSAIALFRVRMSVFRIPTSIVAPYLLLIFGICRGLAAYAYSAAILPLAMFASPRLGIRLAALIAALVLTYPVLRTADLVPVDGMLQLATSIREKRVVSLRGRFANEEVLLEKAHERIWFGWGGYGRNRIYDPETGRDLTNTDGLWIIQLGQRGVVGFVSLFGLLLFPVFTANASLRKILSRRDRVLISSLSLIVAVKAIDFLPNAFFAPYHALLAGALLGLAVGIPAEARALAIARRRDAEVSSAHSGT